jgi:cell division initiation protein
MKEFDTVMRGYDKKQVLKCIDEIIRSYEALLAKSKATEAENKKLFEKIKKYEEIEETLNKALFTAQSASDQIKNSARTEAESIINDAKRNASRIVNDALAKAEKAEFEADTLIRNIQIYKRRVRGIIESQLDVIDEIDKIDLKRYD